MCILPFEINSGNYFSLIGFICTKFDKFRVAQSVEGWSSNL